MAAQDLGRVGEEDHVGIGAAREVRIDQAHAYVADSVSLPLQAERLLQTLMESS